MPADSKLSHCNSMVDPLTLTIKIVVHCHFMKLLYAKFNHAH